MREPGLPVGPAGTLWSPATGATCGGALGITAFHQAGQAQALTGRFGQSQPAGLAPSPIKFLCKVARQREAETRVCLQRPPLTIPQTPSLPSFPPPLFQKTQGLADVHRHPCPQPMPCAEARGPGTSGPALRVHSPSGGEEPRFLGLVVISASGGGQAELLLSVGRGPALPHGGNPWAGQFAVFTNEA